jgi:amino-acid N-acetyltransferase
MISSLTYESVGGPDQPVSGGVPLELRKAQMSDIAPLLTLINGYAGKGIMLPRTEFEISENIRDFSVAYAGETLAGCGALHFYTPILGEVRSLAVDESLKAHGVGRRIVEMLVAEAQAYELDAVFAFTYVAEFFRRMGFDEVERGELPLKAWKDCLRCPKFQCCDEVAMVRVLRPQHWEQTRAGVGVGTPSPFEGEGLILLPKIGKL